MSTMFDRVESVIPLRLNLGAGTNPVEGYVNLDGRQGDAIYPLPYDDESVDEVRASHVLEHFGHREVLDVLKDWSRVLKVGGTMKIAVPDFDAIVRAREQGAPRDLIQAFVMGSQSHERDYHRTLFDADELIAVMRAAGLRSLRRFEADADDCCRYPISLNIEGVKRAPLTLEDVQALEVGAAMSVPRLGFMDNFFAAYRSIGPLGISIQKHSGAYWGLGLERTMTDWVDQGKQWILTVDYDSVWTREALEDLLQLARDHPDVDAIAPLQVHRTEDRPLMTRRDETTGEPITRSSREDFLPELTRVWGAHFGLTLIRTAALRDIPHPWLHARPDDAGTWGPYCTEEDVSFWRRWNDHGKSLYLANHVVIGHCELMVRWPDEAMRTMYQHPTDFYINGPPGNVWK